MKEHQDFRHMRLLNKENWHVSKKVNLVCYLMFSRVRKAGEDCHEGEGNGSNAIEGNGIDASCS